MQQLVEQYQLDMDDSLFTEMTGLVVKLLPGLIFSSLMFGTVVSLMLARWWQAVMYNPGGFATEFQSLRLGRSSALITVALTIAAGMLQTDLLIAIMMIVFTLYMLQGTSLLHALINGMKLNSVWLFVFYALAFFVPHILLLMVVAGVADAYIDFRRRLIA
jgi:hypothetical protein